MATYAALASLMNTIQDIINHPQVSTFFYNNHTQTLLEKTSSLLDFMEANNYGEEAEDLEREIKFAAQEAEKVIDLHIMDQIYAETNLRHSLDLQLYVHNMDVVMEKANEFKVKKRSGEEQCAHGPVPIMEIEETAMVGLDAELESLLYELTRDSKSSRKTISIVGMGGMGKTTLAKNIFESKLIKEYFHFRAWATISQQHDAQEILAQLTSHFEKSSQGSVNDLGEKLHKNLFGRKYLIILDDIWSVKAWDEVKRFFPDNKNGSRIVLTTRISEVANDCGSTLFMMRFLDEDNCWKLFCETTFKNESCPPELWEVGKKIVKSCKGLPLSIVVIGGLLSKSSRTVEYWEGVGRDIKSISKENFDVLYLSYKHLPAHLKPCFLYMGVFKEDSEIKISEVVRLWVGEGFIKLKGSEILEETGEGYIKDLLDRNLILVGRRGKSGKIRFCGIHDLLRDLCIKLSEQQKFLSVIDYPENLNSTMGRFICKHIDFRRFRFLLARSIHVNSLVKQPVKQGLLRVFKTQRNCDSPDKLFGNVNLRCLAHPSLYETMWRMPTSLSLVWNLQTLILDVPYSLDDIVVAPTEIWKMRQLRHVKCFMIYLPPCNGQEGELENLQTLKTTLNLRLCTEVCKVIPNVIKLPLWYDVGKNGYDDNLVDHLCYLDSMQNLESLKLMTEMSGYAQLSEKLRFPSSLKKLSLEYCELGWNDMRMIGSLPQLEVLILTNFSISTDEPNDHKWSPINGQYLRLKFLKMKSSHLKCWDADNSNFPVLEKLLLRRMDYLEEIPLEIGDIPTLELIRVDNCSVSAAISALRIKENMLDNGNDSLQIEVRLWRDDQEEFKERVESEGLSVSNIQFETC